MKSKRWHFEHNGRIFIIYKPDAVEATNAISHFLGYPPSTPVPQESGYYDYATNTIVDAKDGPVIIEENRKVFG